MKRTLWLFAGLLCLQTAPAAFELAAPGRTATICIPAGEPDYVRLSAADLANDTKKITGQVPAIVAHADADSVVLLSMNRPASAALLAQLAPGFGDQLKGKWEAYRVENHGGRLIIAGSDARGTMFGLYAFIEHYLGVDPLWFWASRPPAQRATLAWDNVKLVAGEPTFKFRGWFINDEDLLTEWKLDGGERHINYPYYQRVISPSVSARVFEAALRLQMNLIIPSSFVDLRNPAEARLIEDAARRGLLVTMHHVEPMGVSAFTFDSYWKDRGETVPYSFTQRPEKFREIWRDYAQRWAKFGPQVIWQLGLRGIADRPVWTADPTVPKSDEGRGKLISDAMAAQWQIVREVDARPQPPATTTLWMEGAALHAAGHLKFPAGVAVIFSDNSPGWEMQDDFRTVQREAGRPYGIYYHHQLWGTGPHLVQGVSPQKAHAIFQQVVARGSTNYAMLNVSNIRPFLMGLEAHARMLRDFDTFDPDKFLAAWCAERFGTQAKEVETAYRQLFASFVADPATGKRALLDGEWLHAGTALAKGLQAKLEKKTKPVGKSKVKSASAGKLLKQVHPQLEKIARAGTGAEALAGQLAVANRELFESNFLAQQKIILGLLRWVEAVAEADAAQDAGDASAVARHIGKTKDALALIEAGKALASRGEFKDWFRGDKKMNLPQLAEWTAKLMTAATTSERK
ncbi:MAG: glycosyl hydrolase 115 family protein [Kiritimatiellaeota bacterium]|nr:glycosyl hydrolase 115 family protein [Kiritimatiellota bacterium]